MKKIFILIFNLLFIILLTSCKNEIYSKTNNYLYFDTQIEITFYTKKNEDVSNYFSETIKILEKYDELTNRYKDSQNYNGVYYINNHRGEVIQIEKELYDLISYSINENNLVYYNNVSLFNIAIGKLSDAYHDLFKNHNKESIDDSIYPVITESLDYSLSHIHLYSDNKIKIDDEISLDLGGIVKGYVTEILKKYYDKLNLNYFINCGNSNVYTNCGNLTRKDELLYIGFINPSNTKEIFLKIKAPINKAIVTSGDYQKYFIYNNEICSHILDSRTNKSALTDIRSISVICDNSALGDILSTSLFIMGKDEALNYANENNIDLIIYTIDDEIYYTENISNLIVK